MFNANASTTAMQIGWEDEPTTAIQEQDDRDTKAISFAAGEVIQFYKNENQHQTFIFVKLYQQLF